uniref:Uncharacterized protein n=1 Tax=Anopheles farauti TaxID=69004 RepID=A0A182QU15_9DIPT
MLIIFDKWESRNAIKAPLHRPTVPEEKAFVLITTCQHQLDVRQSDVFITLQVASAQNQKYLRLVGENFIKVDLSLDPDIQLVNVSQNQLTEISVPNEIQTLDASHNHIRNVLGPHNTNLLHLNLRSNKLTDTAWLPNFPSLQELDLSYNELEQISSKSLKKLHHLVKLLLQHNRLMALSLPTALGELQVLDVSHNALVHMEHGNIPFESLTHLYLDHNSIVSIKIASNHSLQNLTMSHNDWDCKRLLKYNYLMEKLNDADQHCREGYQLQRNLCCKETVYPYLDRLNEKIKLTTFAEKVHRGDGRCSANETLASIQNLASFAEHIEARRRYFQTVASKLPNGIRNPEQKQQLLNDLRTQIDVYIHHYIVSKQGLVEASVNLNKVFEELNQAACGLLQPPKQSRLLRQLPT